MSNTRKRRRRRRYKGHRRWSNPKGFYLEAIRRGLVYCDIQWLKMLAGVSVCRVEYERNYNDYLRMQHAMSEVSSLSRNWTRSEEEVSEDGQDSDQVFRLQLPFESSDVSSESEDEQAFEIGRLKTPQEMIDPRLLIRQLPSLNDLCKPQIRNRNKSHKCVTQLTEKRSHKKKKKRVSIDGTVDDVVLASKNQFYSNLVKKDDRLKKKYHRKVPLPSSRPVCPEELSNHKRKAGRNDSNSVVSGSPKRKVDLPLSESIKITPIKRKCTKKARARYTGKKKLEFPGKVMKDILKCNDRFVSTSTVSYKCKSTVDSNLDVSDSETSLERWPIEDRSVKMPSSTVSPSVEMPSSTVSPSVEMPSSTFSPSTSEASSSKLPSHVNDENVEDLLIWKQDDQKITSIISESDFAFDPYPNVSELPSHLLDYILDQDFQFDQFAGFGPPTF